MAACYCRILGALMLASLLIATGPAMFAQAVSTIQITGVVLDATGAVVPGAKVTAVQTGTGLTRSTVSGADGGYALAQLPTARINWPWKRRGSRVTYSGESSRKWARIPPST
jgi:Carboxypeptidase regulatory-like domain